MIGSDGTHTVWLICSGHYPRRVEVACKLTREGAEAYRKEQNKSYLRIEKAYLIYLHGKWRRVLVTPVKCAIPIETTKAWKRKAFTFADRLHILFTGFPKRRLNDTRK